MLDLAFGYAVGLLVGTLIWVYGNSLLDQRALDRKNYRDVTLPTAGGLLLVVAYLVVIGFAVLTPELRSLFSDSGDPRWESLLIFGPATLFLATGFGFLGFVDDIGGVGQSGGFKGHIKSVLSGRPTTGALKMICGPCFALIVVAITGASSGRGGVLRDAALVSLAANLGNLFDRAPGRTIKVYQLVLLALVIFDGSRALVPSVVMGGVAAALLVPDLQEKMMLGDTGSNVLGAVGGFGYVLVADPGSKWVACGVLLALNVLSEFRSFTKVIDSVPPLRFLDRLGSPHRS